MAFSVRVELHNANYEHYEKLHTAMNSCGFSLFITGGDGRVYRLPPAEYYYEGSKTIEQVRDLASASARSTALRFAVYVTEGNRRAWVGLEEKRPQQSPWAFANP